MKTKHLTIIIFLLLIAMPLALAKTDTILEQEGGGLTIVYPKTIYIPYNSTPTLWFDVVNTTSAEKKTNTTTTCTIAISNNTGAILSSGNLDYNSTVQAWTFSDNGFTQKTGIYDFYIYCNNTVAYGFQSLEMLVTSDGRSIENNNTAIIMIVALILFAWLLLKIGFDLDNEHTLLRMLFTIIAIILGVGAVNIGLTVVTTTSLSQAIFNNSTTMYKVVLWTFRLFMVYAVIYYIYRLFRWLTEILHKKGKW